MTLLVTSNVGVVSIRFNIIRFSTILLKHALLYQIQHHTHETMDQITNERRVGDELQERRVTHLLEMVINHSRSTHENYGWYCASVDEMLQQVLVTLLFLEEWSVMVSWRYKCMLSSTTNKWLWNNLTMGNGGLTITICYACVGVGTLWKKMPTFWL